VGVTTFDALKFVRRLEQVGVPSEQAERVVTRQYAEIMKAVGLKSGQFTILATISHHGRLTITELADKMALERTTLSRNVRPLERAGLISISEEQEKRRRYIELTKLGKATYEEALPLWNEAQHQFREQLGAKNSIVLKSLLKRTSEVAKGAKS
jgi:DNA-binding MarR family transcriptional regulator